MILIVAITVLPIVVLWELSRRYPALATQEKFLNRATVFGMVTSLAGLGASVLSGFSLASNPADYFAQSIGITLPRPMNTLAWFAQSLWVVGDIGLMVAPYLARKLTFGVFETSLHIGTLVPFFQMSWGLETVLQLCLTYTAMIVLVVKADLPLSTLAKVIWPPWTIAAGMGRYGLMSALLVGMEVLRWGKSFFGTDDLVATSLMLLGSAALARFAWMEWQGGFTFGKYWYWLNGAYVAGSGIKLFQTLPDTGWAIALKFALVAIGAFYLRDVLGLPKDPVSPNASVSHIAILDPEQELILAEKAERQRNFQEAARHRSNAEAIRTARASMQSNGWFRLVVVQLSLP